MNKKLILIITALVISAAISLLYFSNRGNKPYTKKLNREILEKSLNLGTQFIINNQKAEGNFNYEYDFLNDSQSKGDSEVRQAGALWGVSLIFQYRPKLETLTSFKKGIDFFTKNSKESKDARKWIVYPGSKQGRTGTVALFCLAIIDFLRASQSVPAEYNNRLKNDLNKYLTFLKALLTKENRFYSSYDIKTGKGIGLPSPYFDGETLLTFIKAYKYSGKNELKPLIIKIAEATYKEYVKEALSKKLDLDKTKGFYQWGSMSFFEIATTGWEGMEYYGDKVIELAMWMIDIHHTLKRKRNTAYAYEGIIHAYRLAKQKKMTKEAGKLKEVIDKGLSKLTSWQVGGPIPNKYLQDNPTKSKFAIGGIMNHRKEPGLRIDVTQHQMHAVILALKYVY